MSAAKFSQCCGRSYQMAKFLFIHRQSPDQECQQPSPEQMQKIMAQWGEWFEKVGAAIVDRGDGLQPTGKIMRRGTVTDGPFIEAKELVGGYMILQAATYDEAVGYAKSSPLVDTGGSVEIRELAGFSEQAKT
jgi:hypothetical protein